MQQITGSIMPGKRVCRLKSEWAVVDGENGRNVDSMLDHDRRRGVGRPGE